MIKSVLSAALMGAVLSFVPFSTAFAGGQVLTVEVDESQILQLPKTPGAIVIGNPSVADVSIQGQKIFVHGRGYGETNLTILDLEGNQMANFNLVGINTKQTTLQVFRGVERSSYSCAPSCEAQVQLGDSGAHMSNTISQLGAKMGLASGVNTVEAAAPTNPQ
jgi:Flp pilus assembly secretin CpaC